MRPVPTCGKSTQKPKARYLPQHIPPSLYLPPLRDPSLSHPLPITPPRPLSTPQLTPQLLALQRLPQHHLRRLRRPLPQWASPKFGIFICLTCAGHHRGLGVHISFVRSITMDAFKAGEIARMELGGNEGWKAFWSSKDREGGGDGVWKVPPSAQVLEERYGGDVGEEWKERLSCRVEGREFAGVPQRRKAPVRTAEGPHSKKEANEAWFARLGDENASRPEGVAPSQGGKYAGFGSEPARGEAGEKTMPGVDEFQKDPVAALTKGFGWFTSTVGKGAKNVNEGWVKPTAQKIAEADLASQARQTALSVSQSIQTGAESLNRLIDESGQQRTKPLEPERRDFWDSFGAPEPNDPYPATTKATTTTTKKAGAIGTAAMRKGGGTGAKEEGWGKDDTWDDF
ncbi:ADP-ribosylation factor GTpase-activating protein GCS1 [Physcia stellaris]|nr:ADP-ribosylation factor GTpase-activating protein GCS1 [Physcia stellaris]